MPCAILAQISTKLWILESRKTPTYRRSGVETTRMCAARGLRGKLQATENITIRYSSRINDWWQLYISINWCWCSRILEHSCAWSELSYPNHAHPTETYHQWTDHWKSEGWPEDELSTVLPGTMSILYINSLILLSNYYHNNAYAHTATHLSTSKLRSDANVHIPLMLCPVQTLCVLAPVCLLRNGKFESKQKSRYLIRGYNLRPTPFRHDSKHQPPFPKCTHASQLKTIFSISGVYPIHKSKYMPGWS